MKQGFISGGNTGISYEELQRRRKIADQLLRGSGSAPRNVGEGLHAIGQAIAGRMMQSRLDKREAAMRDQFNQDFASVAPGGVPKAAELAGNPMASPGQKRVLEALLAGVPGFARGTTYAPGGTAVVGENGPEIINLPQGSQVIPTHLLKLYQSEMQGQIPRGTTEMMMRQPMPTQGRMFEEGNEDDDAPEWYRALDPARREEFDAMPPEEKRRINDGFERGLPADDLFNPNGMDLRELIGPDSNLRPQPGFNDAAAYQTAQSGEVATDALPYGSEKLTEGQSKDINYFRRAYSANMELSDPKLEMALTQFSDNFANNFGGVGRLFQDAEYQKARRAANEFLAMVLRKDTGAAVTNQEFELYGPIYLPMPGDKPEVIEAKRNARQQFIKGLEMGSGTAAPLYGIARDELKPSDMSDEDLLRLLGGGQ